MLLENHWLCDSQFCDTVTLSNHYCITTALFAPTLEAASPPPPSESPPRYSKVKACVTIPSGGQTALPERKGTALVGFWLLSKVGLCKVLKGVQNAAGNLYGIQFANYRPDMVAV